VRVIKRPDPPPLNPLPPGEGEIFFGIIFEIMKK
jgi:hypothetical protein